MTSNSRLNVIHAIRLDPGDADSGVKAYFVPSGSIFTFAAPLNHLRPEKRCVRSSRKPTRTSSLAEGSERNAKRTGCLISGISSSDAREGIEGGKEAPLRDTSVEDRRRRASFTIPQTEESPTIDEHPSSFRRRPATPCPWHGGRCSADKVTLYLDQDIGRSIKRCLVRDTAAA